MLVFGGFLPDSELKPNLPGLNLAPCPWGPGPGLSDLTLYHHPPFPPRAGLLPHMFTLQRGPALPLSCWCSLIMSFPGFILFHSTSVIGHPMYFIVTLFVCLPQREHKFQGSRYCMKNGWVKIKTTTTTKQKLKRKNGWVNANLLFHYETGPHLFRAEVDHNIKCLHSPPSPLLMYIHSLRLLMDNFGRFQYKGWES